ncbi:hypothetical protein [Enterobacter kobei]|uniref:hypothetical protein n=1 Tax=Enterobacter kobei TaxID=208224 RepID=UPI003966A9D4
MSDLVKRGHDQAAELKSSCGARVAQLISDLATQLDVQLARSNALAAENAALKAALNPEVIPEVAVEAFTETVIMDHDWNETSEWSWVENDTDVIRAVLEAIKPETPATEAFQAEVRASGIDEWIASRDGRWNGTTAEAERFAANLRKGVQS